MTKEELINEHRRSIKRLLRRKRLYRVFVPLNWEEKRKDLHRQLSWEYRMLCKLQRLTLRELHVREPELFDNPPKKRYPWLD